MAPSVRGSCWLSSRITAIVQDELDDDDISLSMETRANEVVEGWDSLAHVRKKTVVIAVERAFKTQFQTVQITALKDVGDLVRLVQNSSTA